MKLVILFVLSPINFCFADDSDGRSNKIELKPVTESTREQTSTMSIRQMVEAILRDNDTEPVDPEKETSTQAPRNGSVISRNPNDISFYLYPDKYDSAISKVILLNEHASLKRSGYDSKKALIIIIHGFSEDYTCEFSQSTKEELLNSNIKSNILVVDWGKLSTPIGGLLNFVLYPFAARNIVLVGRRISEFVKFLISSGALTGPEKVHMIGYDLGAHVAGVAAYRMLQNITNSSNIYPSSFLPVARITGLDPSGPLFHMTARLEHKLDSTDATFVDIIHTNQGIIGYIGSIGHADFYPNGGGPFQPGCPDIINSNGYCAHRKAFMYYIKSITDTSLKACRCSSYVDVVCRNECKHSATLGHHCPSNSRGKFYIDLKTEERNVINVQTQMKMMAASEPKKATK